MRLLVAVLVFCAAMAASAIALTQQPPRSTADQEYVPVDPSAAQEQLPAAPLVMGAYAVVWIVVVLYVWSIWRRLSAVERELAQVSQRIGSGDRR